MQFLLGFAGGSETGEERAVEQIAEQEVDREKNGFGPREVNGVFTGEHGGGEGRDHDGRTGNEPDDDLCEADGAYTDELAGEHVAGLDGGEHDLEDAGGLLLNDGAGDVHAIDHGGHGEQQGHDVALPERGLGAALDD